MPRVSIIIPALNEEHSIRETLKAVSQLRGDCEVILVDGGSTDDTVRIANEFHVRIISSQRGRGVQMHTGACAATGEAFWFLHADTRSPPNSLELINHALADAGVAGGNFSVRFEGESRPARFLTWFYPQLRRIGVCYGDSAIFVRRSTYLEIEGFKPFPIFEDLDLVTQLRRKGRVIHLPAIVITSSRRFENRSFALTFTRWMLMQVLYWAGVHPQTLARLYAPIRSRRMKAEG